VQRFLARTTVPLHRAAPGRSTSTLEPGRRDGDGVAMAYRAGAPVANMEFFQFHPTVPLPPNAKSFLVTEAIRGEGAILRRPDGEAFMKTLRPARELAPRDIVARAIDNEMKVHGFDSCSSTSRTATRSSCARASRTSTRRACASGIDMTRQPIPVVPAAHYLCGGVVVDLDGATALPRLYACGEAACTGLHGANRLASNSLLEALVFAHRASADACRRLAEDSRRWPGLAPWDPGHATDSDESVVVTQNWEEVRRFM
jgi:L-aspartate oxidase